MRPNGNTPPANRGQLGLNPLLKGFDSIYLGYYGQIPKLMYQALDVSDYRVTISEMEFSIRQTPRGLYRFVLDNDCLNISLGNRMPSQTSPSVYVQVKSAFIHSAGIEPAHEQVLEVVSRIYDGSPYHEQVSRVDPFVDIAWSKRFYPEDVGKFTTKAKNTVTHNHAGKVNGFTFGKGNIMARIYDKTLEVRNSGKDWFYDLWGVGKGTQVWRVEFQLRREALKDFGIETFADLMAQAQALWNYCVNDWLRVRATGKQKARRDLINFWEIVQAAKFGDGDAKLIKRERLRSGMTEKQIFDQMAGLTRCYARGRGIDNHSNALDIMIPRIRERLI